MGRKANSFARPKPKLKPQPKLLVICEDSKSGKRYLEDASLYFRVKVQVEISHCGKTDPLNIVKEALSRQAKFDQVFCTIDRDTHETFDKALELAKTRKIEIIASYPCFEFWLLLHFGYSRKPFAAGKHSAADGLIKELKTCSGLENYDKGNDKAIFDLLLSRLDDARKIASKVLADAISSGEMNPSTRIHELLGHFEKLAKPQEISEHLTSET